MAPLRSWADLLATPAQPAGPFYPLKLQLDDDNDLTQVARVTDAASGDVIHVMGRVLELSGVVLPGARGAEFV